MKQRLVVSTLVLALAGCASAPHATRENALMPATPANRYIPEPLGNAATVDEMRAAPAPAIPDLATGTNPSGDRNRLAAQGYVLIGTGNFPGTENVVREEAIRQGRQVGAERIVLYAPPEETESRREWRASYFVRFQLPFGATFRDLRNEERITLGAAGGVQIGSVVTDTPASRANLRTGDFVLKFDGKPVLDRNAFQSLLKSRAGHPVTLTIVRNGETLQRVVRLGAMIR